ncbi:MAG: glycoside hydrolase family 95 protein [Planctomycetes bacterium]|nr:glycoside hydrolase family 95 protein [Planctomycetota bacterium]
MNTPARAALLVTAALAVDLAAQGFRPPPRGFVSAQPAATWEQGLLCGNGTIGASVLSQPLDETIVFSHERLFLPEHPPVMPPDTGPRLFEIRRLIERGLYQQASELAFDISGQPSFLYPDPFVPAFDLRIRMDADGEPADYLRSVDFETGEALVRWSDARGTFERRLFVSRADGVAILRITGSRPGAVGCRLALEPREPDHPRYQRNVVDLERTADATALTWRNRYANAYPGSIQALEAVASLRLTNGTARADGAALVVDGADEVLVLLGIAPVYDPERSRLDELRAAHAALPDGYSTLLARHAAIHGALFRRVRLDLGGGADHRLTTEELIARSTDDAPSRALIEKEFDAGRYNIISSTGELPPTLQGVWAGTWDPPWASDFTHNGNVPSAIASMLMGNTPELMLAYTSYLEWLVPYLEVNADRIFGARGIVLPSRSTTNGFNNALAPRFAGAFWVDGAAWAAHFFYDYWLYTGDREFLARHARPFMEKAALFFEDYLIEGADGRYVFVPTQSPENAPANTRSQATFNATMSVAAAKELLHNLIALSEELGVNQDKVGRWQTMLAMMPEYRINADGAVQEWLTPELTDNYAHRHSSQLYPLFDGMPDEIAASPALQAAFRRVIELKLDRHWGDWERQKGFMSFGLVQVGLAAASLGEAELAYRTLVPLVNRYWLPNLASTHNYRSLFNMDISGGMPAVILRMLVDSRPGSVRLLPALPAAWPTGSVEGVLCRGQVTIQRLAWRPGAIDVTLASGCDQRIVLQAPSVVAAVTPGSGPPPIMDAERGDRCEVELTAGGVARFELRLR